MKKKSRIKNNAFIYTLAALIFIVPLVVFIKVVEEPASMQSILGRTTTVDLFAYYKARILQIGALVLFICAIYYRYKKNISIKPTIFEGLLAAFAGVIVLSYLFSDYKEVAFQGAFDRYEGTLTWLSYCALAYSVSTFVESRRDANILIGAFVLSASIVSVIGTFQYLGFDFFKSDIGKRLILGSYFDQVGNSLTFPFPDKMVYSTLYNSNYVGSLIALAVPLTVYLLKETRRLSLRMGLVFSLVFQAVSLYGSRSTGGLIAVAVIVLAMVVHFVWIHPKRKVLIPVMTFVLLSVSFIGLQLSHVQRGLEKLWPKSEQSDVNHVVSVDLEDNMLNFTLTDGSSFSLTPQDHNLAVEGFEGAELVEIQTEDTLRIKFQNEEYEVGVIYFFNESAVYVVVADQATRVSQRIPVDFYYSSTFSIGATPLTSENLIAKKFSLFKNEGIFSSRGYIWNRTIPLIGRNPVLGYGADTYVLHFPKVDLLARTKVFWDHNKLVDKPHNIYLQLATNFGLLGLLAWIALIAYSLTKGQNFLIILSIVGVLITGIVNDSVVSITTMFFVVLALLSKDIFREKLGDRHG